MTLARPSGKLGRMTFRSSWALLLPALVASTAGCSGGTETGNPPFTGALSYTGYSSEPSRVGVRAAGSALSVREAWLDLEGVSLSASGRCGLSSDAALALPGLGVGDHAAGAHVVTSFEATSAVFCQVEIPFVRAAAPASGPAQLPGNSILLLGELADGTPFSVASRLTPVVALEATAGGFSLAPERAHLLLAFDFAAWLADVDFDGAERAGGEVRIDASHNLAALHAFEGRLSRGVSLHRDVDGDGVLDAGSAPIAEAP